MLKKLRVHNFRSLHDVEVSLALLTTLVGPNMSGKSNILDALRFLYECWFPQPGTFGPVNAIARRGGIDEVLWKGGKDKLLSIAVEFEDPQRRERSLEYLIEIVGAAGGYVNVQSEQLRLRQEKQVSELIVRELDGRWLQTLDGQRLVRVESERSAMELAPPNWDGFALKTFAQNLRLYQLVPQVMKQVNPVTAGRVLDIHGENLSAWLMWLQTRSPESFQRITEIVGDVFPEVQKLSTWPTQQGTVYLASQEKSLKGTIPLLQMSDGELAFIAFVSLICAPDEASAPLFLIEEPENHLHPKLIETMFGLLRQVQQEVRERNSSPAQILLTTHSPYVLNQMDLSEIRWVEKKNGETVIICPSDKTHLRKLVEDKELGIGDLMLTGALGG